MGGSVHDSSYVALARISYVVPLVFWGWESGYLLMKEHRGKQVLEIRTDSKHGCATCPLLDMLIFMVAVVRSSPSIWLVVEDDSLFSIRVFCRLRLSAIESRLYLDIDVP